MKEQGVDVDVVIVGGGPAGLEAGLMLGRGMKSVRIFDAGPPRNARATGIMGFVTRDGVAPLEFRKIAREELTRYGVVVESGRVHQIGGEPGRFEISHDQGVTVARRVILSVGMIDEPLAIPGAEIYWGHHIFQCPYCHGWEHRGLPWGVLATSLEVLEHAPMFLGWTDRLTAFVGDLVIADELAHKLAERGIRLERRPVEAFEGKDGKLLAVKVAGGSVPIEALIARPPQHQTPLVTSLGLELEPSGFVKVDARRQTSRPGIFAAGDLCSQMQSAIGAAAAGQFAGAVVNADLTL